MRKQSIKELRDLAQEWYAEARHLRDNYQLECIAMQAVTLDKCARKLESIVGTVPCVIETLNLKTGKVERIVRYEKTP